jgi:hypothetical protein
MEKSMDGEMREMMVERLALGDRLARDGLIGDDDVADIWGRGRALPGGAPETTARWWAHSCRANRG